MVFDIGWTTGVIVKTCQKLKCFSFSFSLLLQLCYTYTNTVITRKNQRVTHQKKRGSEKEGRHNSKQIKTVTAKGGSH